MDDTRLLLLLSPLIVLEVAMKIVALVSLFRREHVRGPKPVWAAAILFVSLFGWLLYFLVGRTDEGAGAHE